MLIVHYPFTMCSEYRHLDSNCLTTVMFSVHDFVITLGTDYGYFNLELTLNTAKSNHKMAAIGDDEAVRRISS